MPKVSIIIPVYNVESYIKKCLDSILNQTFSDFEIICVYDESEDKTVDILKEYVEIDNRIRLIDNEKQGISNARNLGILNAHGEYLQFVDSDDWLEPKCLELAHNKIFETNADIVCFAYNHYEYNYDNLKGNTLSQIETYQKNPSYLNRYIDLVWICWNKIFKKSFLLENNILFPKEVIYAEDGVFNLLCLYNKPKLEGLTEVLYNYMGYRENSSTILKKNNTIKLEQVALDYLIKTREYINADKELKILTVDKACRGAYSQYKLNKNKITFKQLIDFSDFVEKNIDKTLLSKCYEYKIVKRKANQSFIKKIIECFK